MIKMKHKLQLLVILSLSYFGVTQASTSSDPYVMGFEAYAKEVASIERKEGYIGKSISLPKPIKVMEDVYTVVGSMIWHNPSNYGLNNNLTFMIFEDGVFVFNAGPNATVASAFHKQIKSITNKPVKWIAVENSQGHAYLGASYWVDIGVKNLYSHKRSNDDFHNNFDYIKSHWASRVGRVITRSTRDVSDKFTTFEDNLVINVGGGETVELLNFGPGHTPGSTLLYVPSRNLLLTGDVAYNYRMLAFFSYTNTLQWVETFRNMMDSVPSDIVIIPGHGKPTNMARIKKDTYDYLIYMHAEVQKVIDKGTSEKGAEEIDQSAYQDRPVFNETHKANARHIYREMTGGYLGENFE